MSQTPAAPQVSGKMFLYDQPELLNKETHNGLGVSPAAAPFGFAAKVRALPLTVSEIIPASQQYPVVFMSLEEPTPMAVVGLIDDINLFVDETGQWEQDVYIPGYVRRYPFGVATEENGDRFAIVVDAGFEGLKQGGDAPLFEADGEPSKFTQDAVEFTKKYEQDRQLTSQFVSEMKAVDVLAGQTAQYTPGNAGDPVGFAQYIGLDENKLKDLPDEGFLELRRKGLLPLLYAQAMSMNNWRGVVMRRARRYNLNDANLFQPLNLS
ncbi:MAG: SapC family protein [Pseudomonadota bacterium]